MKRVLLVGAISAGAVFITSQVFAADSTAYMAQCKANIANEPAPPNMTADQRLQFCQCFVEQVGDDQATLDEATAMSKLPRDDRMAKFPSASDKFKAAIGACAQKMGLQPPPQPPKAN